MANTKSAKAMASAIATGQRVREAALANYLANPNYCEFCNKVIEVKEGEAPCIARSKKYCGHGCAAAANNRKFPKRKPEGECDECGAPVKSCQKWCSPKCKAATSWKRKQDTIKKNGVYVANFRQRQKQKAVEYKGGKCVVCGYNRYVGALDFHHLDPTKKDFSLSVSGVTRSWEKTKNELDKCILACAVCHREIHGGLVDLTQYGGGLLTS